MSYKCLECGHIFDEGEQWYEDRGAPYRELMSGCPMCYGDYAPTERCEICGSEHLPDELCNGICEECLMFYAEDLEVCHEIGNDCYFDVKINSFLAQVFTEQEIDKILFGALRQNIDENITRAIQWVNADREWFAEGLEQRRRKGVKI